MLVASLASAATDPLAAWIAHLYGAPMVSAANTLVLYLPNFACAVVAILPSHVLHRLGRRLRQAQEMGSYQLVELLGRGGMGEVWRAKHRLLARGAAIKLIRPELLGAGSHAEAYNMLRRFEREAQATAALSSPHTIQVFDFGATADQTFYYVMELLDGRDLQSLVREFGPLPAARALFLLRQVCHSLAEAHARGLVHRDVTPSNIYVCRMGLDYDFVKVLDFGLVKFNGRRSLEPAESGRFHTTTGTPAFMAPEIILGAEIDQRADVYAIGCVAYYLLTGQPVFEADDAQGAVRHAPAGGAGPAVAPHRDADFAGARRAGAGVPRQGSASSSAGCRRGARDAGPLPVERALGQRSRQKLVGTPSRGAVRPSGGVRRPAARTLLRHPLERVSDQRRLP